MLLEVVRQHRYRRHILKPCVATPCHCEFAYCLSNSSDQARDSITSYLTGEPGKFEANGNHTAEVIPEAKAKPFFSESQNDVGKQSIKENLKPKTHGCGRAEEPVLPLTAYQKSLEETSKLVIEDAPKPCVPVGMKKMTRTTADGKARLNLQEEEGPTRSEPKVRHLRKPCDKVRHLRRQRALVILRTHGLLYN